MKNKFLAKLIIILFAILNVNILIAQNIPQNFNYQAVARNNEGQSIAFQEIILEISIIKGNDCANSSCNLVYQEIHTPTTNSFGLFSVEIGDGQNTYAGTETDFKNIDWYNVVAGNEYYLKVRVDFGDANVLNGLVEMGVTKFQSVPYSNISGETGFSHLADSANFADLAADVELVNGKLPFNLTELADVNIGTASNSQVLQYVDGQWVNANVASGSSTLASLGDVNIPTPSANQVLSFDIGTLKWIHSNLSITNISEFNVAATPNLNEILVWNGTKWTNQPNSSASAWTETVNSLYYSGIKNIGIGTSSPLDGFHAILQAGKGALFTGTYNGGVGQDLGAGTRLHFYPTNSSFRVGTVDGVQWNDVNVGDYSVAMGVNNTASGSASFAMGHSNTVKGTNSTAFGFNNLIELPSSNSVVFGQNNTASAGSVLIIGKGNTGGNLNSIVVGENNNIPTLSNPSKGTHSLTVGINNNTNSDFSATIGDGNQVNGICSVTFGYQNQAISSYSNYSFATGYQNDVQAPASNALGKGLQTLAYAMTVVGQYNQTFGNSQTAWTLNEPVFVVGNGTGPLVRLDAFIVYNNGNAWLQNDLTVKTYLTHAKSLTNKSDLKIENPLEIIKQIQGITWKDEDVNVSNRINYGFDTQTLKTVLPEFVHKNNDSESIDYVSMIPILLEAIKEQQKQIENLENQIKELKK